MPRSKEKPHGGNRGAIKSVHPNINPILSTAQTEFIAVMESIGLTTKDPVLADGRLHRFHVEGDRPGSKNGWYVLYGDGLPAGAFGCWKRGVSQNWCAKTKTAMTSAEREAFRSRMEEVRKAHEIENMARRQEAAEKAAAIWKAAPSAPENHPYLLKKNVRNHGLRLHRGALVTPLYDGAGILHSLQFIGPDGEKRFLSGGRITGCFYLIGAPIDRLCIAEGYATASSIHEATGYAVAVTAQDLVDRAVSLELPLINERSEVGTLWEDFEKHQPEILGGLLDIMANALTILPSITLPRHQRPRMIEFARFGMAVAKASGHDPCVFLDQFNISRQEAIARTLDASPVATALMEWFDERRRVSVEMPLNALMKAVSTNKPDGAEAWPRSAKGFADALRRAAPALRHNGIECKSLGKIGGLVKWSVSNLMIKENFDNQENLSKISPECPVSPTEGKSSKDIKTCRTSIPDISLDAEAVEERAAIMEFDAGLPRDQAEKLALQDVIKNLMERLGHDR